MNRPRASMSLIDLSARRPRAVLLIAMLATTAAVLLMVVRLRPETTIEGLLDQSDPAVAAMARVLEHFPVVDELLVLATLPDDAPADDASKLVAFADRLQSGLEHDDDARQVISQVRYRAGPQARAYVEKVVVPNAIYYLSDDQVAEALRRLTPDGMREQLRRNEAMLSAPGPAAGALAKTLARDPLRLHEFLIDRLSDLALPGGSRTGMGAPGPGGDDAFFSPDGRSLLIRVGGGRSPNDFNFSTRLMRDVRRLVGAANTEHLRIDVTGGYAIAEQSSSRIRSDSIVGTVSSVFGLAALFAVIYRRPGRSFVLAFVPIAAGLIWGFGVYAILRRTITPLAAVVGGALGGIGIDYTIHYLTRYHDVRRSIADSIAATSQTTRLVFRPLVAAWFTSVIGFVAIAVSPVPVLRDFSLLGTLCLIGVWIATLLVLPAMLALRGAHDDEALAHRVPVAPRLGRWMARRSRAILLISCVLVAGMIVYIATKASPYELEPDVMMLHPQPSPPLEAQRFIAQRMDVTAGAILLHVRADSPEQLVTRSNAAQERLRSEPVHAVGVRGVFGLASLLPEPEVAARRRASLDPQLAERAVSDLREALRDSSFNPDAYGDYLAFLRRIVSPGAPPDIAALVAYPEMAQLLLPREALEPGASARASEAVVLVFFHHPLETRIERDAAVHAIRAATSDLSGVTVTGMAAIGSDIDRTIHRDLFRLIGVAFGCIGLYLLAHFRSLSLATLALIPTIISGIGLIGFMSLSGMRLNLVNIVMAPILLGINVDYGIFVAHAWRTSRGVRELLRQFDPLATAMLTCGGTTIIGFGSLVLTSIPAVRSLGWLINVGVIGCMLATLFVLWDGMMAFLLRRPQPLARRRDPSP